MLLHLCELHMHANQINAILCVLLVQMGSTAGWQQDYLIAALFNKSNFSILFVGNVTVFQLFITNFSQS